ncbi:restriction endonuclease [Asticcacaulis endophyticus]|uniref:Restriction endonuclease type IV Mrr domain-containing protein n=1 Tax=Asticcacaulis endophyticus TaxID=1395890 RepID=A0A918Q4Y9_9CAUL|nr:restriction endonuclease [Asticcacaulis endophyticus]GGZ32232.1 hypothetical protein GCM10011273_17900 [Asticcacaulis endophyticus]
MDKTIIVQCKRCAHLFEVDGDDLNVQQDGADERGMGLEVFYHGAIGAHCPQCRSPFEIEYEASEYPVGMPNYAEYHPTGVTIVKGVPLVDFSFHDEDYDYETVDKSESGLIVPERKLIVGHLNDGVAELILEIKKRHNLIHDIDPRQFEEIIAHVFKNNGFVVDLTKRSRDGGRDVIALRNDMGIPCKYIIECKKYAPQNKVGVGLVRSLFGVQMNEGANKAILATTSEFTAGAKKFAATKHTAEWFLDLKDYNHVMDWILKDQG